jgi:hypothetical protein
MSRIRTVKQRVLSRLKDASTICREEFLVDAPARSRARNLQFKILNTVFQQLVVEGILFTVDKSGDHALFRHHGRAFPKLWRRRQIPKEIK